MSSGGWSISLLLGLKHQSEVTIAAVAALGPGRFSSRRHRRVRSDHRDTRVASETDSIDLGPRSRGIHVRGACVVLGNAPLHHGSLRATACFVPLPWRNHDRCIRVSISSVCDRAGSQVWERLCSWVHSSIFRAELTTLHGPLMWNVF